MGQMQPQMGQMQPQMGQMLTNRPGGGLLGSGGGSQQGGVGFAGGASAGRGLSMQAQARLREQTAGMGPGGYFDSNGTYIPRDIRGIEIASGPSGREYTKFCMYFAKGGCRNGVTCCFIHDTNAPQGMIDIAGISNTGGAPPNAHIVNGQLVPRGRGTGMQLMGRGGGGMGRGSGNNFARFSQGGGATFTMQLPGMK